MTASHRRPHRGSPSGIPRPKLLRFFSLAASFGLAVGTLQAAGSAAARLTVNSNAGSMSSSSTNTTGSFQLENLSGDGQKITSFKIDLRTAVLPDIVFDPAGTAGDPDGKEFALDSFNGSGTPTHGFESPHNGSDSGDGYDILRVDCDSGVDFGPGDLLTFSSDIDPTSVKGAPGPGPEHSASISGLELIGATATVTFDDGTVRAVRLSGITGTSNTNKTSVGVMASGNPAAPSLSVPGNNSPFTVTSQPAIRVSGTPGATVRVWTFSSGLYLDGVPGGGYDIDPYETNKILAYSYTTATISGSGSVDVPGALVYSAQTGGINQVAALLEGPGGARSSCSNILVIDYRPGGIEPDTEPPSTPTDLQATAVTAGSVTLGWIESTDNRGVSGYEIHRDGEAIAFVNGPPFTDGGLSPSTGYNYQVEAYDDAGNQSGYASLSVTTTADMEDPTVPAELQAIAGDGVVHLYWGASGDDAGVAGYRIHRDGSLIATLDGLGYTDEGLANGTEYDYEVIAFDLAGNESPPAAVSATPGEIGTVGDVVLRVDAGSTNSHVDSRGRTWAADNGYNTGYTDTNSDVILGTDDPGIYHSRRIDRSTGSELVYSFDVPNGNYLVVLHFVEVWTEGFAAGARVFDITGEGALVVNDMDIYARAGARTACLVEFPVTVTDGNLQIGFEHVIQNPVISGIEVFQIQPYVPPPTFEEWLAARGLAGQTGVDSDGGGLGNLAEYYLQLDPNDSADDRSFALHIQIAGDTAEISFPDLLPTGTYHLHRSVTPADIGNVSNRIRSVTPAQIEAMPAEQRSEYTVDDPVSGVSVFYQLSFEPTGG